MVDRERKNIMQRKAHEEQAALHENAVASDINNSGSMDRRGFISYTALAAMAGLSTVVLGSCGGGGGSGGSAGTVNGSGENVTSSRIVSALQPIRNIRMGVLFPQYPDIAQYKVSDFITHKGYLNRSNRRVLLRRTCKSKVFSVTGDTMMRIITELELRFAAATIIDVIGLVAGMVACTGLSGGGCAGLLLLLAALIIVEAKEGDRLIENMKKTLGGGVQIHYEICYENGIPIAVWPTGATVFPLVEGPITYSNASFAGVWDFTEQRYLSDGTLHVTHVGDIRYDTNGNKVSYSMSGCANICGNKRGIGKSYKVKVKPDGRFRVEGVGTCACFPNDAYWVRRAGNGNFISPTSFLDGGTVYDISMVTNQVIRVRTYVRKAKKR